MYVAHLDLARLAHQASCTRLPVRLDAAFPYRETVITPAERRVVSRIARRRAVIHHYVVQSLTPRQVLCRLPESVGLSWSARLEC